METHTHNLFILFLKSLVDRRGHPKASSIPHWQNKSPHKWNEKRRFFPNYRREKPKVSHLLTFTSNSCQTVYLAPKMFGLPFYKSFKRKPLSNAPATNRVRRYCFFSAHTALVVSTRKKSNFRGYCILMKDYVFFPSFEYMNRAQYDQINKV